MPVRGVIFLIRLLPESATKRLIPSVVMPLGVEKLAPTPVPSEDPAKPDPANVVTTPVAISIRLITRFPESATKRLVPSVVIPFGLLNLAVVPVPLVALLTTPPPAKVRAVPNKLSGVPCIPPPIKPATGTMPSVTVKLVDDFAVIPAFVTVIGPLATPVGAVTTSEVAVADVTTAGVPKNLTSLFAAIASKFVPLIVTTVPTPPLSGVKLVTAGSVPGIGMTINVWDETAFPPGVVTVIFPLVALGTVTVSNVVVACVTTAGVPLNETKFRPGTASKLVPPIVTVEPTIPLAGELVIEGAWASAVVLTTKDVGDVALPPAVATVISPPLSVPAGTMTTSEVDVAEATTAGRLLEKRTELFAATVSKFVPLMVIAEPTVCQDGENPLIVGAPL